MLVKGHKLFSYIIIKKSRIHLVLSKINRTFANELAILRKQLNISRLYVEIH